MKIDRWNLIKSTEMRTSESQGPETQTTEMPISTIEKRKMQKKEEEEKFNKAIGKWMLRIAGIILCVNVLCRVVDAGKSREYVQVSGTVTKTQTTDELRAGKRLYTYHVWVTYPIQGMDWPQYISEKNSSFDMFSTGDHVPVLYRKDNFFEAYIAKKDWMTGAYLPASKSYNIPLVISIVLMVVGFLLYANSPVLDWYIRAGEITIGKKRVIEKREVWSYKQKGWITGGLAMIVAGGAAFLVFSGCLLNSFNGGDYLSLSVLFVVSMLFLVPGILIVKWAKGGGKK